jgi:hypothetical protein
MKKWLIGIGVVLLAGSVWAQTYLFTPAVNKRKVKVVRDYEMTVTPHQIHIAEIPAMIGFQGATNEQVIESSEFTYSVKPDKIEITSDDLGGMPRKYYKLTWNDPGVDKIQVNEKMIVSLTMRNRLPTSAKLPYSKAIRTTYAAYLEEDKKDKLDPNNPELKKIRKTIRTKNAYAEDVVEAVCDWINDMVKYDTKARYEAGGTLENKKGESRSLSKLACAMIRRFGIPCDIVHGKLIGKEAGHYCIEVYYPDAGWVFYEICHRQRGFRTLDGLLASGGSYRTQTAGKGVKWVNGYFCKEEDLVDYKEAPRDPNQVLRPTPKASTRGVMVTHTPIPPKMPVRQESIRELILDLSYPPGGEIVNDKEQKKPNPRTSGRK